MTSTAMRRLLALGAAGVLLAGCGSQAAPASSQPGSSSSSGSASASGKTHTMSDGTTMTDAEMKKMRDSGESHEHGKGDAESASAPGSVTHRGAGPSQPAGMICSLEVAQAVQRTFALPSTPRATDTWADPAYTCVYQLPTSTLRLSVQDLHETKAGRTFFDALGHRIPGARPIKGLQNLGFPALETPGSTGEVAFLKDGKTLLVDASRVVAKDLPPGFSRTAAAYGVAAAVIACWTE
jgi:hypothetical protein